MSESGSMTTGDETPTWWKATLSDIKSNHSPPQTWVTGFVKSTFGKVIIATQVAPEVLGFDSLIRKGFDLIAQLQTNAELQEEILRRSLGG